MRIAMVGPFGFHPNKTMRARAFRLASPLAAGGHQVALFMPPWHTPEEADRTWVEEGVRVRYLPLQGGTAGITRRMVREVLAYRPDVVHCFKPKAYSGLVGWWLWQFHRRRLRLVIDTDDWEGWGGWNELAPYSTIQKHFFAWQEQWGLHHTHALTVASRALQTLAWGAGVPAERVHYLPNGPGIGPKSEEAARQRELLGLQGRPVLLLYSRLFEFDVERLVALLAQVQAALPELAVLAVGSGLYDSDAAYLRQLLAEAGLAEAVTDVGWLEEAALPAVLGAADVGLYLMEDTLLNRTKCPVKLADMLSVGVPVVAEAVGQVSEYVLHRRTGLLAASGDTLALAEGVISLLQDGSLRHHLAVNAQRYINTHFAWERLAADLEAVYRGKKGK